MSTVHGETNTKTRIISQTAGGRVLGSHPLYQDQPSLGNPPLPVASGSARKPRSACAVQVGHQIRFLRQEARLRQTNRRQTLRLSLAGRKGVLEDDLHPLRLLRCRHRKTQTTSHCRHRTMLVEMLEERRRKDRQDRCARIRSSLKTSLGQCSPAVVNRTRHLGGDRGWALSGAPAF